MVEFVKFCCFFIFLKEGLLSDSIIWLSKRTFVGVFLGLSKKPKIVQKK